MSHFLTYEVSGRNEYQVLDNGEPIGFVFKGRQIGPRTHLWYAFDLDYEAVGNEHLKRSHAAFTLSRHQQQTERQQNP